MFSGKQSVLRVGTLNCQGLNEYYTRMALFESLKESNLAIIFLQETKLKPELEYKYILRNGIMVIVFLIQQLVVKVVQQY